MHHLRVNEDSAEGAPVNRKRVLGVTADGTMWIYHLVQYAHVLLNQPKHAQSSKAFSPVQRQAWDRWDNRTKMTGCSLVAPSFEWIFGFSLTQSILHISADLQVK